MRVFKGATGRDVGNSPPSLIYLICKAQFSGLLRSLKKEGALVKKRADVLGDYGGGLGGAWGW